MEKHFHETTIEGLQMISTTKYACAAITLLASCGMPDPTFQTVHGLNLFDDSEYHVKQYNIEVATEALILRASAIIEEDKIRGAISHGHLNVFAEAEDIPCGDDALCGGMTIRNEIHYWHHSCVVVTSFAHELMHFVLWAVGEQDRDHLPAAIWDRDNGIVREAELDACEIICPGICLGERPTKQL